MVKQRLFKSLAVLLAAVTTIDIRTEIPITELSGMSICTVNGYEEYSPAIGALYWYSPFVRNLYEFGPEKYATKKLAKELFFVHHDQVTFDVTWSATKIACYFTPADIGAIIGYLHKYKEDKGAAQKCIDSLVKNVIMQKTVEIKKAIVQQMATNTNRKKQECDQLLQNILEMERWADVKQKLLKAVDEGNDKEISKLLKGSSQSGTLQRLVIDITKNKKAIATQDITKPMGYLEGNTYSFASLVVDSFKQDKDITVGLLLALLWKRGNSRVDVVEYLKALEQTVAAGEIFSREIITAPLFARDDYERLKQQFSKPLEHVPALEELLFYRYGYYLYEAPLPEIVGMIAAVKSICEEPFSDCGETSLRNFFNALLYNPVTRNFDSTILKQLGANKKLLDFYSKFPTADTMQTKQVHDEWAMVLSGLPNVEYNRAGGCEISSHTSGSKNMLKVINNLLPGIDSFNNLAEKLAQLNIGLNIEGEPADQPCVIDFSIQKPGSDAISIGWHFNTGHFFIEYPFIQMAGSEQIKELLLSKIKQESEDHGWSNVMLATVFGVTFNELTNVEFRENMLGLLFLLPINTADNKVAFAGNIMRLVPKCGNIPDELEVIVKKLYAMLPDDYGILSDFAGQIMALNDLESIKLQKMLLSLPLDALRKTALMKAIIVKAIPAEECSIEVIKPLYAWVVDKFKEVPDVYKVDIISSIIERSLTHNDKCLELVRPLYDWVKNSLKTLTPYQSKEVLDSLLGMPLPGCQANLPLVEPLYQWAMSLLEKEGRGSIGFLVGDIAKRPLPKNDMELKLVEPWYNWAQKNIINVIYEKNWTVKTIVSVPIPNDEKNLELVRPLFVWAFANLEKIAPHERSEVIKSVIAQVLPSNKKSIEMAKPLYDWVISSIKNINYKFDLFGLILAQPIPDAPELLELINSLYAWAQNNFVHIEQEFKPGFIVRIARIKLARHDEMSRKLVEPLYKWAKSNLADILEAVTDKQKYLFIKGILNIPLDPENMESMELVSGLYGWIKNNLQTLSSYNQREIIGIILDKSISSEEKVRSMIKLLYGAVVNSLQSLQKGDGQKICRDLVLRKSSLSDMFTLEQWQQIEKCAQ